MGIYERDYMRGGAGAAAWDPTRGRASSQRRFLVSTYVHLWVAIGAFCLMEFALFRTGWAYDILSIMPLNGRGWLVVLALFTGVGGLASYVAESVENKLAQYAALAAYALAEAIIFVPMIWIALAFCPEVIQPAVVATLASFTGLTLVALFTGNSFSFLRGAVCWGGMCALILIVLACLFGLELGTWFSLGMIALAGANILRETSELMKRGDDDREVAAALALFASVALLFWCVLRLLIQLRGRS